MLRISLSGTHSSGKTTLLESLKENEEIKSFGVQFIDGVTRKVKKMGVAINEDGGNATQLLCMSMDILNYHSVQDGVVISDRCLLDTFVYTKYLYLRNKVSEETFSIVSKAWEMYKGSYDLILLPNHFEVPIQDDNERSTNREFRDSIFFLFMEEVNQNAGFFTTFMASGSVKERVEIVIDLIKKNNSIQ